MMPRNVLFIGNSHTAAARIALRDQPGRWPGFEPDIFAMPGHSIAELELQDRCLHPKNDEIRRQMEYWNGIPDLPLSCYEAFVVMGCLSFASLASLQEDHRSSDFPSVMRGEPCQPVSTGLVDAMIAHRIARSPALGLIRMLAGLGQGPVLYLDTVFPSADCRDDPEKFLPYVEMAGRGDGPAYHTRYLRLLHQALGADARHIAQPADTVTDGIFTAPEWMRGSIMMLPRSDIPHEEREYGHANAAYGALQLDQITAVLGGL